MNLIKDNKGVCFLFRTVLYTKRSNTDNQRTHTISNVNDDIQRHNRADDVLNENSLKK